MTVLFGSITLYNIAILYLITLNNLFVIISNVYFLFGIYFLSFFTFFMSTYTNL